MTGADLRKGFCEASLRSRITRETRARLTATGYSTLPEASQFRPRGDKLGIYSEALHEAVEQICVKLPECVAGFEGGLALISFTNHPSFFWPRYRP